MDIKPYEASDRVACLEVFESLTPDFLDPGARPQFESWLDADAGKYFVMEHEGRVVGCGGFSFSTDPGIATLHWGMVRRSHHKTGLGRFLLMYRMREIGKAGTARIVRAQAPPQSAGFFEKQGFRLGKTGIDGVEITRKLAVCP